MTGKKDWSAPVLRVGGRIFGRRLLFPVSSLLSNLSSLARRRRANWAYRERLQLVSRSPQVLGGDQTIPENKTCSRRGGAFLLRAARWASGLFCVALCSGEAERQKARRAPTAEENSALAGTGVPALVSGIR